MRNNKKFIIGFFIFDAILILVIVLYIVIANPFSDTVAPSVTATTPATVVTNSGSSKKKTSLSRIEELSMESMQVLPKEPEFTGLKQDFTMTDDGAYYTSYTGYLQIDVDGDGAEEYFSVSLDEHSEAFYFLARKGDKVVDFVVPGTDFTMNDTYGVKACKGQIRGFAIDLNPSDPYLEIGVILERDNWKEYDTIIGRFDGEKIHASRVHGFLSGLSDSSGVQFATYDTIYGVHKLYRNYTITDETDFLREEGPYFTKHDVERARFMQNLATDVKCTNLNNEEVTLSGGTSVYWGRTDNETFVDLFTQEGYVFRLPMRSDVVHYETGDQTVYYLGDKYASDLFAES